MIKISRTNPPEYLSEERVLKETEEAKQLFDPSLSITASLEEKRKKFSYKRYRDDKVKDALKDMCHNKCAYCESTFLHVYYGDIEHFRPKKFVGTKKDPRIPGYYWLANDWDNLLLSCLFCNQAKKHEVLSDGQLVEVTIGKQNQFPLSDNQLYDQLRSHKDWENGRDGDEEPFRLIIDPCKEDPEQHFRYNDEGMILPQMKGEGNQTMEDPRGKASIEVYALQRIYLVQERKKRLIDLKLQIRKVEEVFKRIHDMDFNANPVISSYFSGKLKESIDLLFHYTHKKQVFSAMCRQFVYDFLKERLNRSDEEIKQAETTVHAAIDENED